MAVVALGVRDRSFKTALGGFDPVGVRTALDAAASAFDALEAEIDTLRGHQADATQEIERIAELERSLLRSCVAAEEDARIRCGAARRYATRMIAAAEEQAALRVDAPARERDRLRRQIEVLDHQRRRAAEALHALIAELHDAGHAACQTIEDAAANEDVADASEDPMVGVFATQGATPEAVDERPAPSAPWPSARVPAAVPEIAAAPVVPTSNSATSGDAVAARPVAAASIAASQREPEHQESAVQLRAPRTRRLRVPLTAGSAAVLMLLLQGSASVPRPNDNAPVISVAGMGGTTEAPAVTVPKGAPVAAAEPAGEPTKTPLTLRIRPIRTCWVRVIADDRTDARELQAGEDILLTAQHAIVLRAGDAGALSVELNGRVLPPLGADGQVVERQFSAPRAAQ